MAVVILQYMSVSNQHITHLKLTHYYMLVIAQWSWGEDGLVQLIPEIYKIILEHKAQSTLEIAGVLIQSQTISWKIIQTSHVSYQEHNCGYNLFLGGNSGFRLVLKETLTLPWFPWRRAQNRLSSPGLSFAVPTTLATEFLNYVLVTTR